jgi:hypothetical protein
MTMLRVRQTATSSAPMPNARPWRRRQRPAAAQRCAEGAGLDGVDRGRSTISCAVPRTGESLTTSLTGADAPMRASPTSRIYTCLTDVTRGCYGQATGRPFASQPAALFVQRLSTPPQCYAGACRVQTEARRFILVFAQNFGWLAVATPGRPLSVCSEAPYRCASGALDANFAGWFVVSSVGATTAANEAARRSNTANANAT